MLGSFCLSTVPITLVIAIKVNKLTAKRIELSSSTRLLSQEAPVLSRIPVVSGRYSVELADGGGDADKIFLTGINLIEQGYQPKQA